MTQLDKRLSYRSIALAFAFVAPLACAKIDNTNKPLVWEPVLGKTAVEVVNKLESRHYQKQTLNDALSAQLLDAYLKNLDPAKLFLLQSDIDNFARYRTTLDDTLHKGDIEPGFVIFRTYRERMSQRLEKLLANLPASVAAMDFSKDEYLDLNRDKTAAWPKSTAETDELWRLHLKSAVLSLRLTGKKQDEIVKLLDKQSHKTNHQRRCIPDLHECAR